MLQNLDVNKFYFAFVRETAGAAVFFTTAAAVVSIYLYLYLYLCAVGRASTYNAKVHFVDFKINLLSIYFHSTFILLSF